MLTKPTRYKFDGLKTVGEQKVTMAFLKTLGKSTKQISKSFNLVNWKCHVLRAGLLGHFNVFFFSGGIKRFEIR